MLEDYKFEIFNNFSAAVFQVDDYPFILPQELSTPQILTYHCVSSSQLQHTQQTDRFKKNQYFN
jgi:hypothetical protein